MRLRFGLIESHYLEMEKETLLDYIVNSLPVLRSLLFHSQLLYMKIVGAVERSSSADRAMKIKEEYIDIHIHIHICVCVCLCVCVYIYMDIIYRYILYIYRPYFLDLQ